jgi:hypothetical protein
MIQTILKICLLLAVCLGSLSARVRKVGQLPTGFHTIPVWGSDNLKYYYIELFIGHSSSPTSVIIDTGSDFLAFPCTTCPDGQCGKHKYPAYDVHNSPSAQLLKCGAQVGKYKCTKCNKSGHCEFSRFYLEGSGLKGLVWSDFVSIMASQNLNKAENTKRMMLNKRHLADVKGTRATFGCTDKETGLFKSQLANGICGLGPKSFGATNSPTFISSLYTAHKINNKNFSICLGTKGGFLTFGGYNANKHIPGEPIQTVPYFLNYRIRFYSPGFGKLRHQKAAVNSAIIDSGTTYTYFLKPLFRHVRLQFNRWCHNHNSKKKAQYGKSCGGKPIFKTDYCVMYDAKLYNNNIDNFFANFPKLFFRLENHYTYIWFPKDYMFRQGSGGDKQGGYETWCSSINQESMLGNTYSTFGTLFLRHYDVYFNKARKTVSFVRSECEDKAKRSYPIMGIHNYIKKAKIAMASFFSSTSGMVICLFMVLAILAYSANRVYQMRKNADSETKVENDEKNLGQELTQGKEPKTVPAKN